MRVAWCAASARCEFVSWRLIGRVLATALLVLVLVLGELGWGPETSLSVFQWHEGAVLQQIAGASPGVTGLDSRPPGWWPQRALTQMYG